MSSRKKKANQTINNQPTNRQPSTQITAVDTNASNYRSNDMPNPGPHLVWRAVYTFVAWAILAISVPKGQAFFGTLILFAFPLLTDYWKFTPDTLARKRICLTGKWVSGLWCGIGILGLFNMLTVTDEIVNNKPTGALLIEVSANVSVTFIKNLHIPFDWAWGVFALSWILTIVDIAFFQSEKEKFVWREKGIPA